MILSRMTLGQFATAVGAPRRWVQNALRVLKARPLYTEGLARRLSFARAVKEACGMPLKQAFPLAAEALARWPRERVWRHGAADGTAWVEIDLERFLATYAVRLSLARCWYSEHRRGRPERRRRRGLAWAKWYGVDISLLKESLKLTPEERLRRLDEAVEELKRFHLTGS